MIVSSGVQVPDALKKAVLKKNTKDSTTLRNAQNAIVDQVTKVLEGQEVIFSSFFFFIFILFVQYFCECVTLQK